MLIKKNKNLKKNIILVSFSKFFLYIIEIKSQKVHTLNKNIDFLILRISNKKERIL